MSWLADHPLFDQSKTRGDLVPVTVSACPAMIADDESALGYHPED